MTRPPPIQVDDDLIRRDIDSEDILTTHPKLPTSNSWSDFEETVKSRARYLKDLDLEAYKGISGKYPNFKPPWYTGPKSWKCRISKWWR